MKTIEERARIAGLAHQFCKETIEADHKVYEKGYIQGATEQRTIDEKRIAELESFVERATNLIEAEKAFREHLESENKKLVDKACEWLKAYDITFTETPTMLEDFRKAMGE